MAAFQFPDPTVQTTVTNPITGSTYQWKEPPGKWVVTVKMRDVGDIIWEGDNPPSPIGDYKLWYSTDTLELYFYYCDAAGTCAWIPTSKPITLLDDLDTAVAEIKTDIVAANVAINENTNRIASIVYFGETPPTIYPDEDLGNGPEPSELNYKFWLNTTNNELSILRAGEPGKHGENRYSYEVVSGGADLWYGDNAPTEADGDYNLWYHTNDLELLVLIEGQWFPCTPNSRVDDVPTLQEVLEAGPPVALKDIFLTNAENDIIDLSPSEARVVIGTVGAGNAPKFELRHKEGVDDSLALFEIDDGGKRLDIEADGHIDNIHFKFGNQDKFILNKTGDAEFIGRVKVASAVSDDEVVTYAQLKNYLEPEFHRYMWDPTITSFNGYTNGQANQDASAGQFCSMTGQVADAAWHYISDRDLDGNLLRAPLVTESQSSFDLEIYVEGAGDYLQPPYINVYMDGKEYKKRMTVSQCQRSKAVVPPPTFSVFYPWYEMNGPATSWGNEFWEQKREIFIKVK